MNSIILPVVNRVTLCTTLLVQSRRKFSSNKPMEKTKLKRFWKQVSIQSNPDTQKYEILLDKRPLKTPAGSKLVVPYSKKHLALLIAGEWEAQNHVLKHHHLPLVSNI